MIKLTIQNLTRDNLVVSFGENASAGHAVVSPSRPITRTFRSRWISFSPLKEKQSISSLRTYSAHLTKRFRSSWSVLPVPCQFPWQIYRIHVARKYDRIMIFPRRDLSRFLSEIPDTVPLSSLVLPGSHDTMAFYGWPISQCQTLSTPLAVQLRSGIRVLDIRLAVINSRLVSYHGLYPQKTPFQDVLSSIHTFLTDPLTCRETLVMSIKQEDFAKTSPVIFSKLVHEEISFGPGGKEMWFLDNRVPTLGEVRGKVLMFSRFGGDGKEWERGLEGLGMHPTAWPDSERAGFEWMCKGTLVRTQDWYDISSFLSIPEKVAVSTPILLAFPNPIMPTLAITYFSASSLPFALPPIIARGFGWPQWGLGIEGVNSRIGRWLLDLLGDDSGPWQHYRREDEEHGLLRIRGWALADFYKDPDNGVVPLLVEWNFRGRRSGEEGWL